MFPPLDAVVAVMEPTEVVAAMSGTKVWPDTQLDVLPVSAKFSRVPFNPVVDVRFVRVVCPVLVAGAHARDTVLEFGNTPGDLRTVPDSAVGAVATALASWLLTETKRA
jgi:hypothetical protein